MKPPFPKRTPAISLFLIERKSSDLKEPISWSGDGVI